jgi:hypothetical protein
LKHQYQNSPNQGCFFWNNYEQIMFFNYENSREETELFFDFEYFTDLQKGGSL